MPRRNPDVASIDPAWVKGLRAWVKKTFAPKKHYASAKEVVVHLRRLHDVDLQRLWEFLLYTSGLMPRGGASVSLDKMRQKPTSEWTKIGMGNSIFEKLRAKIVHDLQTAERALANGLEHAAFIVDAMTPGTREYEYRSDVREFYLNEAPSGPDEATRKGAFREAVEALTKVDAALSGKMLRTLSSFLAEHAGGFPYEPDAILLEHDIGAVKLIYRAAPEGSDYRHGRDPRNLDAYIPYFLQAKALLERRGLGALWYGPVFISCDKCGGHNPHDPRGITGAHYAVNKDHIVAFIDPKPYMVELLIHEIGHRMFFRNMDSADRARFVSYFGDVKAVSDYGSKHPWEDFAEVFAHFVLGRDLTRDQIERFKAFLAAKDRKRLRNPAQQTARRAPHRQCRMR